MSKPGFYDRYQPPAIDSPTAIANAKTFLCSARSLDSVTAESLSRTYRLSARQAEYELNIANRRRDHAA